MKIKMEISLIVEQNCNACIRATKTLKKIEEKLGEFPLNIIDINEYKGKNISIVPALLINGELFSYGDIDENKLLMYINKE